MRRKLNLGLFVTIILVWAFCVCTVLNTMSVRDVFFELKDDIIPGAITMSKMKYEATAARERQTSRCP
jgi:hypothetical protein